MSAIAIELSQGPELSKLFESGFLSPVAAPGPEAMSALIEGECSISELAVSEWRGPPTTLPGTRREPTLYWLAVALDFPLPNGGTRALQLLRMGLLPAIRLRPVASLSLYGDRALLRFGLRGAPLIAPKVADPRWPALAQKARAQLAPLLAALGAARPVLFCDGLDTADRSQLGAELELPIIARPEELWATPSAKAGPCRQCRHANLETIDFEQERLLACRFGSGRTLDALCDLPAEREGTSGFRFELYDGGNATWNAPNSVWRRSGEKDERGTLAPYGKSVRGR